MAYVSWNGATEVSSWEFWVAHSQTGPWIPAGSVKKVEFETHIELGNDFFPWVSVDAHDEDGNRLSGAMSQTFVPKVNTRKGCNKEGCFDKQYLHYEPRFGKGDQCFISSWRLDTVLPLLFLLVYVEALSWMYSAVILARIRMAPTELGDAYMMLESGVKSMLPDSVLISSIGASGPSRTVSAPLIQPTTRSRRSTLQGTRLSMVREEDQQQTTTAVRTSVDWAYGAEAVRGAASGERVHSRKVSLRQ